MESFFSQKFESWSQTSMAFSLLLTRVIFCDLDLWEGFDIIILFYPPTFISRVINSAQHFVFLERESWSQSYYAFLDCPPAWSCPTSVQIGFYLGMRLCDKRFDKELFSCINFGLSKLSQTQKSFRHRFKANSLWRNSIDSYRHVFRSDKKFVLLLVKIWSDILLVKRFKL